MTSVEAPEEVRTTPPVPLERTDYADRAFKLILTAAALLIPILLGFLVYELWTGASLAITRYGFDFVTSSTWDPVAEEFGAFPLIFGTLLSSLVALLIAVPLSLGVAIYLTEFAPKVVRQPIAFLIGLLAAIPSVVYGLWGIFVLIPVLRTTAFPFLRDALGFLPLFAPGYTMAAAIANEFTEAVGDLHLSALAYVAFTLFLVTVVVNAGARLLIWRVARGSGAGSSAL